MTAETGLPADMLTSDREKFRRERGLAAGTYYLTLTAVSASKGCYYLDWEERP